MADPCDTIKNMANNAAAAAGQVVSQINGLQPVDSQEKKKKEDALKKRYKALQGIYNSLVSLYTRDTLLGGCGGDAGDIDAFPSPILIE